MTMKRLPTLDEQEHGHDVESAYVAGDVDAADAVDAEEARRLVDTFREMFPGFPQSGNALYMGPLD